MRAALRIALSHYVTAGVSAALGLVVITTAVQFFAGAFAASVASVGVLVCIPPDQPAPRRGKFWQLLPAALFGLPLFVGVQFLDAEPVALGLLVVPATFLAFLGGAWGKRGLRIVVSAMFAMIFSMALPHTVNGTSQWTLGLYFVVGAGLYLVWATAANAVLNAHYRAQMLADTLLSLVALMRTRARQFVTAADASALQDPLVGQLLRQHAALADQLQEARDLLFESPSTARRRRLAGMLLQALEMRDHLLSWTLDLDVFKTHPGHEPELERFHQALLNRADDIESLADALLLGRVPEPARDRRSARNRPASNSSQPRPSNRGDFVQPSEPLPAALTRSLADRVDGISDDTLYLFALARGEAEPDTRAVRTAWQMFVTPTAWSWHPLKSVWRRDAPPLRHASRAALAVGTAYAIALALPFGQHNYWILLTIVVVLRGSLAQTLERRNSRVAGTLFGCVIAGALSWGHAPHWALLLTLTLAQALAHGFVVRMYLVTSVASTVLGLLQAHLLEAGGSPAFDVVERMADTLIGAAIAWVFSYVMPSWERNAIPGLVARALAAQARHARVALGLAHLQAGDNEPELAWRLARREAYDSLSALVQATQRAVAEPRAVHPPLEPLERLLARSSQLLAQLTAVKSMLLQHRGQLDTSRMREPLLRAADAIQSALLASPDSAGRTPTAASRDPIPTPLAGSEEGLDLRVLRRLATLQALAAQLRSDADEVSQALAGSAAAGSPGLAEAAPRRA